MNDYLNDARFWFLAFVALLGIVGGLMLAGAAIRDAFYRREDARRREEQGRGRSARSGSRSWPLPKAPLSTTNSCASRSSAQRWSA